jgi:transposase-like protein
MLIYCKKCKKLGKDIIMCYGGRGSSGTVTDWQRYRCPVCNHAYTNIGEKYEPRRNTERAKPGDYK